jgi:hypothetical protein
MTSHPQYKKYAMILNSGLQKAAVRHKMAMDGIKLSPDEANEIRYSPSATATDATTAAAATTTKSPLPVKLTLPAAEGRRAKSKSKTPASRMQKYSMQQAASCKLQTDNHPAVNLFAIFMLKLETKTSRHTRRLNRIQDDHPMTPAECWWCFAFAF